MKKAFITDCEGPVSKNDNAFETAAHFIPHGARLFTVISRYDDALADALKRPNYKPGSTLKFIMPFLKAYGVTDSDMKKFSAQTLILISDAKEALEHARKMAYAFIVSTSYEHYIAAVCKTIGFPFENTYCTRASLDKYRITETEIALYKQLAKTISRMPLIEIPQKANSLQDFSPRDRKTIERLDQIFFEELAKTCAGKMFSEIDPVGGSEKAEAIRDAAKQFGFSLRDVMYVGDSITDEEAFKLVRKNGGLAVAFNGNHYAVRNAEIAVLSESSFATAAIADIFSRLDKQETLEAVAEWNLETLETLHIDKNLLARLFASPPETPPKVKIVTPENMEALAEESSKFRKKVRGETVGGLA
ncbi:MAG: HAD hydrolase family protein [Candidatus Bathyarchaeota archaeon]|nr:HAD hydrolase family protein [Candidatus Bathyarchaeota archaeon]